MTAVSYSATVDTIINKSTCFRMSFSDTVVQGEAIESDDESLVEYEADNEELKVKSNMIFLNGVYWNVQNLI